MMRPKSHRTRMAIPLRPQPSLLDLSPMRRRLKRSRPMRNRQKAPGPRVRSANMMRQPQKTKTTRRPLNPHQRRNPPQRSKRSLRNQRPREAQVGPRRLRTSQLAPPRNSQLREALKASAAEQEAGPTPRRKSESIESGSAVSSRTLASGDKHFVYGEPLCLLLYFLLSASFGFLSLWSVLWDFGALSGPHIIGCSWREEPRLRYPCRLVRGRS